MNMHIYRTQVSHLHTFSAFLASSVSLCSQSLFSVRSAVCAGVSDAVSRASSADLALAAGRRDPRGGRGRNYCSYYRRDVSQTAEEEKVIWGETAAAEQQ